MKKYLYVFIFIIIVAIMIICVIYPKDNELKNGNYYNDDKTSCLQIKAGDTFCFRVHKAMNTAVYGEYMIEGNTLILNSNIGEYRFCIKDNMLIFEEGNYLTDTITKKGTKYRLK